MELFFEGVSNKYMFYDKNTKVYKELAAIKTTAKSESEQI